jgi:mannose-6-phosphate isomerase-like protein (cupin superfamily)
MTLIKGKDIKAKRERNAGAMVKRYPIQPINDMLSWEVVKRNSAEDGEWMTQLHSHPDFEEYWFVISGKGQMVCGDELYDVEPGDLVITPPSVPYKVLGDIEWIACSFKHNVYGHTACGRRCLALLS